MGMSASQARFLSLTARKSNVEFQGQQINQQRTTLSNESASYYSELCNMVVPTPPSVDNYTKISYTFNDGAMTNTITSMLVNHGKDREKAPYLISYIKQWEDDYTPVESASSFVNKTSTGYFIGSTQLRVLGFKIAPTINIDGKNLKVQQDNEGYYVNQTSIKTDYEKCSEEDKANFEYYLLHDDDSVEKVERDANDNFIREDGTQADDDAKVIIALFDENETNPDYAVHLVTYDEEKETFMKEVFNEVTNRVGLTNEQIASITLDMDDAEVTREEAYKYLLNEKYNANDQDGEWYVRYVKNTQTGVEVPYFYKASDLENMTNIGYETANCYTIGTATKTKEVINAPAAIPERDSSGRYISITLYDRDGEDNVDTSSPITYTLTVNTITDEAAYNDALNEYNYQQAQYDKKVQDINSKLEIVQQQDKSLELNLKQLDTEEQAIQTEMDAIQKVISKNVSDSFGTFKTTG